LIFIISRKEALMEMLDDSELNQKELVCVEWISLFPIQ
jgi:hypothetical protein